MPYSTTLFTADFTRRYHIFNTKWRDDVANDQTCAL